MKVEEIGRGVGGLAYGQGGGKEIEINEDEEGSYSDHELMN